MISVIVPIYQCKWNIGQILLDIEAQTYQGYEVLLVDDGSTDGSALVCKEYEEKYEKVRAILKPHSGVGDTRNVGISKAKGEYIAFIDSDDRIEPDYLETLATAVESYDLVISSFDRRFYKNEQLVRELKTTPLSVRIDDIGQLSEVFSHLYITTLIGTVVCKLFKKSIIEENSITFRKDIYLGEDFIFNFDYLRCCKNLRCIEYIGYHYICKDGNSLTHKKDLQKFDYGKILFRASMKFCEDMKLTKDATRGVADLYLRTCFKNIEYAFLLDDKLSWKEQKAYIKKIVSDEDTQCALELSQANAMEFRIYKYVLKMKHPFVVGGFAWLRLLYKKLLGRA